MAELRRAEFVLTEVPLAPIKPPLFVDDTIAKTYRAIVGGAA